MSDTAREPYSTAKAFAINLRESCPRSANEALSIFWSGALAGLALEAGVHGARVLQSRHRELRAGHPLGSLKLKWWVTAAMASAAAVPKGPYHGAVGTLAAGSLWSGIFGSVYVPTRLAVDATAPADQPGWGPALAAAAGSLASSSVRVPLQLVKARMARREFFCSLQAFERIMVQEGPASLYRGWTRNVASNLPFDAALFLLYDVGKTWLIAARQQQQSGAPQPCGRHGAGCEAPSAGPCSGKVCHSRSASATEAPAEAIQQIQRTQAVRPAIAAVQNRQLERQPPLRVQHEAGAATWSVRSAAIAAITEQPAASGAATAEPKAVGVAEGPRSRATGAQSAAAASLSALTPADVAEAEPATGRPVYGFRDAVVVGGVAGATAGLLTSPLEAAVKLMASRCSSGHQSPSETPGSGPVMTSRRASGHHYSSNPRDLGGRGWGAVRVLALPGGLATRAAWAAFEGALFFPALEAAIPLCDWIFTTDGSATDQQEQHPREKPA